MYLKFLFEILCVILESTTIMMVHICDAVYHRKMRNVHCTQFYYPLTLEIQGLTPVIQNTTIGSNSEPLIFSQPIS